MYHARACVLTCKDWAQKPFGPNFVAVLFCVFRASGQQCVVVCVSDCVVNHRVCLLPSNFCLFHVPAQASSRRPGYRLWLPPPRSSWLCRPTALPTSSSLSAGAFVGVGDGVGLTLLFVPVCYLGRLSVLFLFRMGFGPLHISILSGLWFSGPTFGRFLCPRMGPFSAR